MYIYMYIYLYIVYLCYFSRIWHFTDLDTFLDFDLMVGHHVLYSIIVHFGWWQMSHFTDLDIFLDFDFMVDHCVVYSHMIHFDS